MTRDATEIERRILEFIRSEIADKGEAPSIREIAAGVGLRSPSTVAYHLGRLEEGGYLRRERGRNRAVRLT
ncbi:winged helix-turn-helix transcriptional regulator [Streptomyces sp. DT224]|uniref:LexA family protein n=1 Tax=Streptomyces sp. DT224 TaxID=3393426 RepID=UPI003CEC4FCA